MREHNQFGAAATNKRYQIDDNTANTMFGFKVSKMKSNSNYCSMSKLFLGVIFLVRMLGWGMRSGLEHDRASSTPVPVGSIRHEVGSI